MSIEEKIRLQTTGQYLSLYDGDSGLSIYVLYKENQFKNQSNGVDEFYKMNDKILEIIHKVLDKEVKEFSEPQKISPYFIKYQIREELSKNDIIYNKVYVSR